MVRKKNNHLCHVKCVCLGSAVAIAGYFIMTAVVAQLVLRERIALSGAVWGMMAAMGLCAFVGSFVMAKLEKENVLINSLLMAAVFLVIESCVSLLILSGDTKYILVRILLVFLTTVLGGMLGCTAFKKKRRHR